MVKAKQTHTGLDRPLGLQEFEAPRISRQSAHEGGKVVIPMHRPLSPQRRYFRYTFLSEAVDPRATSLPEVISQLPISEAAWAIEPASFRFVAQCLNQKRHRLGHAV